MSTFYPSPPPQHQQRRVGGNTPLEIPRSSYPSPPHPQSTTSPYNPHLRYNPALYNNNATTPISPYPGPRVASQSPHRSGEYNPRDFGGLEYGRVVTPPVQQFQQIQPQQTGDRKISFSFSIDISHFDTLTYVSSIPCGGVGGAYNLVFEYIQFPKISFT